MNYYEASCKYECTMNPQQGITVCKVPSAWFCNQIDKEKVFVGGKCVTNMWLPKNATGQNLLNNEWRSFSFMENLESMLYLNLIGFDFFEFQWIVRQFW